MENDSTKIADVYNAKVVLIKEECRVLKEEITSKFNSFETAVASGAIKHEQECEETIAFITGNVASIIETKEKDLTYVQAIMKVVKYGYAMFDLFVGSVDDSKDVSEKLALTLRADDAFDVLIKRMQPALESKDIERMKNEILHFEDSDEKMQD